MKMRVLVGLLGWGLGSPAFADLPVLDPMQWREAADQVVVEAYDFDFGARPPAIPARYHGDLNSHLFDQFAELEIVRLFDPITTEDWEVKCDFYLDRLARKAREQDMPDANQLYRMMELIKKDSRNQDLALLPIGAFLARQGFRPVYILVVKWERTGIERIFDWENEQEPIKYGYLEMGHIRIYAFRSTDLKPLGFATCG